MEGHLVGAEQLRPQRRLVSEVFTCGTVSGLERWRSKQSSAKRRHAKHHKRGILCHCAEKPEEARSLDGYENIGSASAQLPAPMLVLSRQQGGGQRDLTAKGQEKVFSWMPLVAKALE
ncbi:hypothetical protein NY78_2781 [Desulfovibrio sp. TomC]|nr:hypothetical protein NY78_2781 [Desulfovibrio sp. TomC]